MPTDPDSPTEQDLVESATTDVRADPDASTSSTMRRSIVRAVRRLATPASIVVAWIVVVSQWNETDTGLFQWATITAGIVLAIVTALWLVSLRFPALRRALLPFEGGLVVGASVLAWATGGREVDLLGDRIAIGVAFGVIAALLLAFMQQLVAGRRRAGAWLTGVVVICALAGIAVPATLDWLDSSEGLLPYESTVAGELVGRSSEDGFRLDDVAVLYDSPSLGGGYNDASAAVYGVGYATSAEVVDPMSGLAIASPAPSAGVSEGGPSTPTVRNDWGRLLAQTDGTIQLVVQPGIATGVTGKIIGSLRRGDCSTATGPELLTVPIGRPTEDRVERTLPMRVDDLRLDDKISFVIGTAEPLAPTRCIQLLSGVGIAMAQLGATSFDEECLDPLDLPQGSEYLVRPSTFQDATCAERFDELAQVAAALLVPRDSIDEFRSCHRRQEPGVAISERKLPHGAIAVSYRDTSYGECLMHGVNSMTYGAYGIPSGDQSAIGAVEAPLPYPVEDPGAAVVPSGSAPAAPVGVAPTGSAPAAPVGATDPATEDLDGLTPGELAEKIR